MCLVTSKTKALHRGEPEEFRIPQAVSTPHPRLTTMISRKYAGHSGSGKSHKFPILLPATTAVQIVIRLDETDCRPCSFLRGPKAAPLLLDLFCASSYLELWLNPSGAYSLLGPDVGAASRECIVDLYDLVGSRGRELADRIRGEQTWAARFDILDKFLLDRAEHGPEFLPGVGRAWAMLVDSGGAMPIGRIAKEVGWSHKHLITRFAQQVGLSPKTAARIIRFDRARHLLRENPLSPLHEIAADCGYADQSHLTRDFREFFGITPSAYLMHFQNEFRRPARSSEQGSAPRSIERYEFPTRC